MSKYTGVIGLWLIIILLLIIFIPVLLAMILSYFIGATGKDYYSVIIGISIIIWSMIIIGYYY